MAKHTTKENWSKRRLHEGVTLPSGAVVAIELPNLSLLIKTGKIPNDLVELVIDSQNARKVTREMIVEQVDYTNLLVALTVKDPDLAPGDVQDVVPVEDQEMLVEFALRARDMDAVAHHLGGLETVDSFREVRGL